MKTTDSRTWLVGIILLATMARLIRLDFQPLWWDEGYSVFFATRDFWTMIERTAIDIHPPLYYAVMQLWIRFFGTSTIALRLLSSVIGITTIPFLYALARQLFPNHRIALIAAFLLAISPFHIYYSQEIRMYGLVTLLGLISFYLCLQLLAMTPGTRQTLIRASLYILVTTAALYTQYYAAFILAAEIIFVLSTCLFLERHSFNVRSFTLSRANPLIHWFGAWAAILVLYLPWLVYAGPKLYAYVTSKVRIEKYSPLDPITFLAQHLVAFAVGHLTELVWLGWTSIVMIALVGLALTLTSQRRPQTPLYPSTLPSALYLIVPLGAGYLVNLIFPFHPVHSERLLLIAAPAFYLIAALGIVEISSPSFHPLAQAAGARQREIVAQRAVSSRRAVFGKLALVLMTLISLTSLYDFYTVPRYPNEDYRPLIADLQTMAQPNDLLLAIYPWQIGYLEAYYRGAPLNIIETPNAVWFQEPQQMQNDLEALLKQNTRVWILALQTQGRLIENALELYFRPRTYAVIDQWYGTTRLEMFIRADDPPRTKRALVFENELTIAEWGIATEPLRAGQDSLRVLLDTRNVAPNTFKASVRLTDQNGNVWAQDDREMTGDLQRLGLLTPLGTPPGDYTVRLHVYRARDGKPLRHAEVLGTLRIVAPASPNLAAIPQRREINFENGMRLLGYTTPIAKPGVPTPLTFFWQATRTLEQEFDVMTQIQDARGNIFATTQAAPALGLYPTTRWQANTIVRDPQTITLRGNTPDGDYRLVVTLVDPRNNVRTRSYTIGSLTVKGRAHYFGAPSPSKKLDARLGEMAQLIGYEVRAEANARVVLYWRALATSDTSYKVFVHLVDANGIIRAQRDQIPGADEYPTTSWVKDEYLVDVYDLDAPPGEYTIRIGMYDPATNTRLPVFDSSNQAMGDFIELPTRLVR